MWGGTPDRNMVSAMKGLPADWDVKTKKNVKWIAKLGSQSYGNPVVAGGMVFAGTNNELLRDPKQPGDRGVLMAFRESDGEFLWQHTHLKLESGRANDWPAWSRVSTRTWCATKAKSERGRIRQQRCASRSRRFRRGRGRRPEERQSCHVAGAREWPTPAWWPAKGFALPSYRPPNSSRR